MTKEYNQNDIDNTNINNENNNLPDETYIETNTNNIEEKDKIEIKNKNKSILKTKNNANKKRRSKITTLQNYEPNNSSTCIGDLDNNEKRNIFDEEFEEKQNRRFESIYDNNDENNSLYDNYDNYFDSNKPTRSRRKMTIYSQDDDDLDKDRKTNKNEKEEEEEIDGLCSSRSRKRTMDRIEQRSYNVNPSDNNQLYNEKDKDLDLYELSNKTNDKNFNLNSGSDSNKKDNQYFIDNDQMLGRDITEYKPNQVIPKTEDELLEDLDNLVQSINKGYNNNQTLEECSEILCKYFKSSIINHSQNNIFLMNDKNLTNSNQGSLIDDNSKISMNNSINISSNNVFTGGGSSLFIHKMKYLENKHTLQKNSDQKSSNYYNRNKNSLNSNSKRNQHTLLEDYETRSLSCNSINDINFKNAINTIISFNRNKKIDNINLDISNNSTNIHERCKSIKSINSNQNLNHQISNSNVANFLKDNKDLDYNESSYNSLKINSYHSYQSNISQSNNKNYTKIMNIEEIITENLQVSETIKIMVLGDIVSKKQFFKALKYGENLTFEEMENLNLENNNKDKYPR